MSQPEQDKQAEETPQQAPVDGDQKETQDKKEIADEEREKMLNAENTKHTGAAPQAELEAEERKPKRKIPIGAIKMPGFCRSKSKEPCKEEDTKASENNADAEAAKENVESADKAGNGSTPAKEPKDASANNETAAARGRRILEAVRVPLSNVGNQVGKVFNNLRKKETDAELGQAGLASVETLDDEKNNAVGEDGMETVRLDMEGTDGPPAKPHPFLLCIMAARRNIKYTAAAVALLILALIIIAYACAGPRRVIPQPVKDGKVIAQTSCGYVEGLLEEDAFVFRGIPYAVPPTNDNRFKPSMPLNTISRCWNGTYLAHNASKTCWQRDANGTLSGDENCLHLDIYTPQVTYERPLSVVVMIGADTLSGPSPGVMIPSGKLARVRDMVFVRPNFRLDIFGFLALEALSAGEHPVTSGNYALSDIINVLQWVNLNIQHFGGDKTKVTLWGHRAGGTLVNALVGSRKTKNLFQRAWISSGSGLFPTMERTEAEKENAVFLQTSKCSSASCLRQKDARELMASVPTPWIKRHDSLPETYELTTPKHQWLVNDEVFIQQNIATTFRQNNGENKATLPKIVMGTTAQSGQLPPEFSYNANFTEEMVKRALEKSAIGSKGLTEAAIKQYNATVKGLHTLISDIRVTCPLYAVATSRTDVPFYVVTFPRGQVADADADAAAILGFFPMMTPEQKRHLQAIQTLFSHFVYHGEVEKFEASNRLLIVDQDVLPRPGYDNCKLWMDSKLVPNLASVN